MYPLAALLENGLIEYLRNCHIMDYELHSQPSNVRAYPNESLSYTVPSYSDWLMRRLFRCSPVFEQ